MKIKLIFLMVLLFLGINSPCQPKYSDIPNSPHFKIEKLSDGVWAAIHNDDGGYAICNAGIIDLGDRTIILDPFISPIAARDLIRIAEFLTGRSVSLVINLDPHSDHTNGNLVFASKADIISTPNARKYIERHFKDELEYYRENSSKELVKISEQLKTAVGDEKTELILWQSELKAISESLPELRMTLPNITIKDTMEINGSKRKIVIIPTGIGHTDGDMVAWLPEDKIIFLSDQLFVKRHPYLGDGNPDSLVNNLRKIITLNPVKAVPGHGPVGDLNSIYQMIDYIETLKEIVKNEIQKGTDANKVTEVPMPDRYKDWLIISFYKVNLKFLFHNMTDKAKL